MNRRALLFASIALVLSSLTFAQEAPRKRYLVGTHGPAERFDMRRSVDRLDVDVTRFRVVNGFAAELTEEEVAALKRRADVAFIEPDPIKHALEVAGDAEIRNRNGQTVPYGIDLVKARQVWPVATGATIKVGVVDTGIDPAHPDLASRFRGGHDFVDNDDNPLDLNGHGTHVAGTISAIDNGIGVVGAAPNVELYALRVLDSRGSGTTGDVISAVDWAIANRLNVLNLSLGSSDPSTMEEQAFQRARDAGLLVFAASGNCFSSCEEFPNGNKERVDYPAGYDSVISVGAIDSGSRIASFSQRGSMLEVVAPGVSILSTSRTGLSDISDVTFTDQTFLEADRFTLSPLSDVSGEYVFCGFGRVQDVPASVSGKIALISRGGDMKFGDKVRNVMAAGARAAVIFNNLPESDPNGGLINGTLCRDSNSSGTCINQDDLNFSFILTVSISKEDGDPLAQNNRGVINVSSRPDDYVYNQGTSMASPHAAGVGALIWSVAPNATAAEVASAILSTTSDLGAAGFDTIFGLGLIDAFAAAKKLAPERFVASDPPPRAVHRRR